MPMTDAQKLTTGAFLDLPQSKIKIQCMHVWIDGTLKNFRSKDKTLPNKPEHVEDLELMEFCGSATDFDVGNLADYYSKPVKLYRDPFRGNDNCLVFCETYSRDGLPTFANNRFRLLSVAEKLSNKNLQFIFHQPYTLVDRNGHLLTILHPAFHTDSKSGFEFGKEIADSHYKVSLYAGVNLRSYESVSRHGQWCYSIGSSNCIDVCDDIWMSRLLLLRLAEEFGVDASFNNSTRNSCFVPSFAKLSIITDGFDLIGEQKFLDELLSLFIVKEGKAVNMTSSPKMIEICNINTDVDPYAILTKVLEALSRF